MYSQLLTKTCTPIYSIQYTFTCIHKKREIKKIMEKNRIHLHININTLLTLSAILKSQHQHGGVVDEVA